jgi:hypothetical protein
VSAAGVPVAVAEEISEVRRDQREFERYVSTRLNDLRTEVAAIDKHLTQHSTQVNTQIDTVGRMVDRLIVPVVGAALVGAGSVILQLVMWWLGKTGGP